MAKNSTLRSLAARQTDMQVETDGDLRVSVADLRFDYGQIDEAHRSTVKRAALEIHRWQRNTIELGKTLLAVKEVLEHGQFQEWMKVEFDSGLRVLQQSMNVARLLKDNPKAHDYALLSADALYLLASPSTPDVVRWEIQERIELTDWRPTRRDILRRIRAERTLQPKQLTGPAPSLEDDTMASGPQVIEAEYTVIQSDADLIQLTLTRSMLRKLHVAVVRNNRIWDVFTSEELDRLNIILSNALKSE